VSLSCTTLSPWYGSVAVVSVSKTNWPPPSSNVTPPFTTETFADALPKLKLTTSPISYPVPPSSITTSCIEPDPTGPIFNDEPVPPAVRAISSPSLYKAPSFVITLLSIMPVIVTDTVTSESVLSTPVIVDQR